MGLEHPRGGRRPYWVRACRSKRQQGQARAGVDHLVPAAAAARPAIRHEPAETRRVGYTTNSAPQQLARQLQSPAQVDVIPARPDERNAPLQAA